MRVLDDEILKEKIINRVTKEFSGKDVIAIYFGGSIAYGLYEEGKSDIDLNIIIKDCETPYRQRMIGSYDCFIYDGATYEEKQKFNVWLPGYCYLHIDEALALPRTLVFIHPEYKEWFLNVSRPRVEEHILEFLKTFIIENNSLMGKSKLNKRLYHVLRMRDIIENFRETHEFKLTIKDETKRLIREFKKNTNNDRGKQIYEAEIIKAFEGIKAYYGGLIKEGIKNGSK